MCRDLRSLRACCWEFKNPLYAILRPRDWGKAGLTAEEVTEHEAPPKCIVHGAAAAQWLRHSRLTFLSFSLSLQKTDSTLTWVSAGQRALNKTKSSCVVFARNGNNSCWSQRTDYCNVRCLGFCYLFLLYCELFVFLFLQSLFIFWHIHMLQFKEKNLSASPGITDLAEELCSCSESILWFSSEISSRSQTYAPWGAV